MCIPTGIVCMFVWVFVRMKLNRKVGNDVNGASIQRNRGFASGRGGGYGATQVVNQRKPCTRREGRLFNGKKEICVGTWNVRTLYAPGQLDILLHQLKRIRWGIIGLAEVRWPGEGEIGKEGCKKCGENKD